MRRPALIGRSEQKRGNGGRIPRKRALPPSCSLFLLVGILAFPAAAQTQTPGFVLSPSPVHVDEGGTAIYTVKLATQPSGLVEFRIEPYQSQYRDEEYWVPPYLNIVSRAEFTPSDWSTPKRVWVTIGEDSQSINWKVWLTHTAISGGYESVTADHEVWVRDNDAATQGEITVTPIVPEVTEGEPALFLVRLDPAPSAKLLWPFLDLEWDGEFYKYKSTGWALPDAFGPGRPTWIIAPQTVDDQVQEEDGSVTVSVDPTGFDGYRVGSPGSATVVIRDNDGGVDTRPTASISAGPAVTEGESATFTVTVTPAPAAPLPIGLFVESSRENFVSAGDLGVKEVTVGTAGSASYSVTIADDNVEGLDGQITVYLSPGQGYKVGTPNQARVGVTDNDETAPTVTITGVPAKINSTVAITAVFSFSENVIGFVPGDVEVTGATKGRFTGRFDGTERRYTLAITPDGSVDVVVTVPVDAAIDDSGTTGPASAVSATAVWDASVPTVTITDVPAKINTQDPFTATFSFSEAVTGFVTGDVEVTGATKGAFTAVSATTYTLAVTPDGSEDVVFTVAANAATDGANLGPASAVSATAVWDASVPTVTITDVPAKINAQDPFTATFSFSEAVTGFVTGDVEVTGATKGAFTAVSATAYTLAVTPDGSEDVVFTVAANAATDGTNTGPALAVSATAVWDASVPTVTITDVPAKINTQDPFTATFTFSEAVTGFVTGDVEVTGATKGAFTAVSATAYTLAVTPDGSEDVVFTVEADAATDGVNTGPVSAVSATAAWEAPTATLVLTPATIAESGAGNASTVTATLSHAAGAPVTLTVAATPVAPAAAGDFALSSATTLTFAAGRTASTGAVTVTATDNSADAPDKTVTVAAAAAGGDVTNPASRTLTITDDDATAVTLSVPDAAALEGSTIDTARITLTLNRGLAAGESLGVPLAFAGGTAGTDFTLALPDPAPTGVTLSGTTVTFTGRAGGSADEATLTLTASADADTTDDTVTVSIPAASTGNAPVLAATGLGGGATGSRTGSGVITLTDNAAAGAAIVESGDDTEVTEAAGAGNTDTYTLALTAAPRADVTVTVTAPAGLQVDGPDAATTGSVSETLTFTSGNWSTPQIVTVFGVDDDVDQGASRTLAIEHTPSSADTRYNTLDIADVDVTVTDDDTRGVTVNPARLSLRETDDAATQNKEEHKGSYTVKLNSQPTATVTVTISGHASSDVSPDTTSLEFTVAKWSEAQTVTVTAAEDDDAGDDEVTLAHTASGGDYGTVTADVVVTVDDDDTVGLVIAPAAVSVSEGGSQTYTVELATEPSATVTVAISGQAGSDVSLDKASLEFTAAKWSEAQTVTVTAAQDDGAGDDEVTLAHTASGGDYGTVTADVVVTVDDDDTVGLVVAPAAVSVSEGGSQTYTVELATEPSATVTVAISGHAGSDVSLDKASLEFTAAKWSEAQTVTVTAAEDDDAGDDEVTLAHTASGGDYGTVTADVVVTVQDDDTVGLVIAPAAVSVSEGGSRTYTVELATEPSATVTVAISGQAGSDVSLDKASLEFTVAKWSEAQTVTVTAAQDDDAGDDEVTLAHTASGGDYGTVTADVVVTVQDDDTVGLVIAPAAVSVSEGGSRTYTVELATEPSATVTVAISGHASSDVSLDKASLEFTVAKWSEAQTVTVTAAEDDDAGDDEVTLAHTASGGDYGTVTADVVVTVQDDDTVGLVIAPAAVSVSEGGSASYTVELATEPSATVTVAISGHASSDVSLDKASLEFTVAKWSEAQTVTVTAAQDADAGDDEVTLAHTASGGDYGTVTADVVVTVDDDDTAGLVVAPAAVSVSEGGSASYTVELATEPSATVTVAISGHASSDVSLDKASLEFTVAKWSEAQTVTVTAAQDDDAGDDEVTLAHAASGGDYGTVTADVVVTVQDDDTVGLVVAPAAVTVAEADDPTTQNIAEHQGTYTVALATEPSATVTVTISGQAGSDVSVDKETLTFTAAKWNEAQTVTVTAAQDDDAGDDEVTLAHTASGGDYGTVTADVVVTVQDDDTVGLVIAPAAVSVSEGGSQTYTVELATEPSATVTVTISGHASSDVSLDKASLTFTAAKWSEAQTVTVTAAQDDDAGDDEVTLAHTASGGDYGTVTADVVVTVQDDDTVGLVIAPAAVSVSEGGSQTYTVELATEPSATVTVTISGHASSDVSVDTTSLEFTVAKWSEAQTVTVTAAQDDDAGDDKVTLAHTASGGDYGSVTADVVVTVDDDDTVGLVIAPAAVSVSEGGSRTYTVELATEPSATVTVAISGQAGSDVSLDKASLTFTVAKWSEAQTVTVMAAQDDDAGDDEVTLAHTASGGDYGTVTADVVVTVDDDDTVGLVVAPAAVSVSEGGSQTYTVELATEPSATVTVTISGHASSDVSLDKASLTFTAAKWSEAQTVTVTAAQDDDAGDDKVTLAHAASGGDYGTVTADVVVTVDDDDTVGLVVAPAAVSVSEGGSQTYTVELATEPSATVTVTISGHASSDVSLDTTSLEFTVAKWSEAQTVTVTAAQDDDAGDDEVTLAHTASGGDYGTVTADVVVTVDDDDTVGLVIAPAAVSVSEGGSQTYTVELATEPSATVTVTISGHASSDVSLDTTSLEFTVAKWSEAQTVTVTAAEDDDAGDDEVTLAHTASGGDYGSVTADVVVTVDDDDTVGLVIAPAAVSVSEGGSRTYTVELATEPSATVTVTISGHASSDVSVDTTSLEFTVAKWSEAQTVTVTAAQDDDAGDDEVTLAHTASGGDYGSVTADVVVTVDDDDTVGLVVAPAAVSVSEGGSRTYTVKLATEPSATVTVAISGQAGSDVSLDKASLEFTAAKWSEAQTVTVTAAQDDDAGDDEVTLAHTASGGDYGTVTADVVVTVDDDDTVGLVVAPAAVSVSEGGSQTYTVKLATEPSATVTVAISGQAGSDVSLDKASLEFTAAKWSEAQTVTVTAAQDDDAGDDEVTLAHTASGGDYGTVTADVVVTVDDDDTVGLVIAPAAVSVSEGGSRTYTVELATEPSATVTVAISGHASSDVSLDKASLEFTAAKWSEAQTVTVTAAQDADAGDDEVTLAHTASGGDYGTVTADVVVTVDDDDTVGLVIAPAAVSVSEGGSQTYTVELATEPSATVTVAISGQAGSDVSLDKASLEFTAAKWSEAQTVTVTAAQDADAGDDEVTLAHTASGGDYGTVTADVVVTVQDDDTAGLVVAPAAVSVSEGGSASYTVELATEPSATVTVAISGHASSDVSLDKASLEFTVAKWSEAQTVTVTAAQDDDAGDDEVTLAHAASGGDYGTVTADVVVTVQDDDTVGLVVAPAAVTVAEADDPTTQNIAEHQGTYTVALATEPSATVTVTISGQAGSDVSVDKETLTFTAAKWNEAQTVTVTAAQDDDAGDDEVTLAHTASGGDYGTVTADVVVTVQDDDTVGLVIAPAAVSVSEGGSQTYTVELATEPSATVTVTISGHASSDVSLDKASLTFTAAKWSEAQTVTVTAAQDDDAGDDEVTLAHTASGGDYGTVTADVVVTVQDDDTVGLVIAPAAVSVSEGGSQTYTVELATEPSATVTVTISGHASSDVSVDTTSLEFTVAKWSEAQTVTVTAAQDDDAGDDKVTLAHTASGGDYGSVTADVVVTVDDDDTVGLVIAPAAVSVSEGGSRTYTVELATEPSATVTVAISGQAGSDVSLDKASLTFTVAKWSEAQTVTVMAAQDDDAGDDEVTLAHTASGGDYGTVTADVVVTVDDDDTVGLVVAPAAVSVSEGGSQTYTVELATEPSATVTVTISGHASSDVSLDKASLTFTAAKWSEAQTVTVTAAQDDDAGDDKVTLAHAASGGDYGTVTADVVVTVDDDDTVGLVVAPAAVSVSEGGSQTYTVELATEPSATVTVTISGHASSDVSLDTTSLEFTVAKWSEAQTVTVTAAQDDDAGDDEVTLAHTASGGDYGTVTADVVVTVDDDDTVGLVIAPAAVSVSEGGSQTYTVELATEPSATVTVTISGHASSDVSLDKASLEFTAAKWSEAQTVTVTAAQDADAGDDEVTLAHTASGGDYGTVTADVVVTVDDDDTVGLVIAPAAVTVAEGGSASYTVELSTEPSATVTVAISGQAGSDVSLDKASLEFTAAKWSEAQTVTVTASEDDDAGDDEVTLAHAASGGDYGSVTADVVVTVQDDDTVGLVVAPAAVSVSEGGSASYTVKLSTEPSATVTVTISGHASSDVSLDKASLEFTAAKWSEAQTVTVTAAQDDDAGDDEVTLAHTASGGDYGTVTADVVVTVDDDDTVGLVIAPAAVTVAEGGSASYTVELATEPSATVTVAISGQAGSDVSLDKASLEFTAAKWSEAQTVTVTAAQDADAGDDEVTLAHTASGGDYGSVTADVVVTVDDDETVGLVVAPAAVTVAEGGSQTYTVKLSTEPTGTVTVTISGHASSDVSLDTTSLEFTVAKWSEAQTVTVTASEDDDAGDDEVTLAHAASGGDYGSVTADVVVTVDDDETVGLVVAPAAVTVAEGGSQTYTVKLSTEPTGTVTVTISGHASSDVSLDTTSLEFTVAKWSEAQTVTVTASEDDDAGDDKVTLAHAASGGGYGTVTADVVVTVQDDDTVGLVVAPAALTVAEGASASYTVELSTEPSGTVTVGIAGHAGTDVSVDTTTLTFTVAKWNEAQTVTVTASEDADAGDDEMTLTHTASGGGYGTVTADVVVTVQDDDEAPTGITLSAAPDRVAENGGAQTVTVTAAVNGQTRYAEAQTVTVSVGGGTAESPADYAAVANFDITIAGGAGSGSGSFTLTPVDDAVDEGDETIGVTGVSGALTITAATITITDNDSAPPALVVKPSALTVAEGGSASYTVELATEPSATVTVGISGHSGTDVSPDATSLTFTAAKWSEAQTVTVTAAQDADAGDDEVTLAHTASGGDYGSVTADVVVTVTDDDEAPTGITLSAAPDRVAENGGAQTVTVTAAVNGQTRYAEAQTVTVSVGGGTAESPADYAAVANFDITIAGGAGSGSGSFTLTPVDDAVDEGDETIGVTGVSGALTITPETITLVDNDSAPPALVVKPSALTVEEGASATYTVELATEPTGTVTVAISGHASSDVSVDTTSLEFTAAKWAEAQTVTVTAAQDADAGDDEVTLAHAASGGDYAGVTADVVVTVEDDDEAPTGITLSAAPDRVAENGGAQTIAVTAAVNGQTRYAEAQTVTVSVGGGTAESPADYAAVANFDITIGAGAASASGSFTLTPVDDAVDEEDETIGVTGVSGALTITAETITITDDDTVGLVVRPSSLTVGEGGSASYTVALATEPTGTVTVAIGGMSGTDLSVDETSLEFTASAWGTAQTVTVTAGQDADAANDAATLRHTASGGDYGSVTANVEVTVDDDDTVGLVVDPAAVTVAEGGSRTYTVKLATEPTGTVTVAIGGMSGTDLSVDETSLEFTASAWGTAQTVTAGEDADGVNDTATLRHTASGGGYGSVRKDLPVTVEDDDEVSTEVHLRLDPTSVSEGAGPAEVTVTAALNAATLPTDVVVEVTVSPDSAGAEDFAAVRPLALTIGAGARSVTAAFTFTPVDDVIDEPDESVAVSGRITAPPESALTVRPAVLRIVDDDETPAISIADAGAVESAGRIVFPVTLAGASARTITVSYRTADGTAEAGADYEAGAGEVSFAPGETERSVTIAVIDDALDEADETFLVQLGEAEHATVADGEATGTITDEDRAPLITIEDASEVESAGGIGFVVTLDAPSGRPISVVCRSADGTATAGDDYVEEVGVLRFEPGETQKTIAMELIDDALDEGDEQFLLNLSEPENVRLAAEVVSAVGTIEDDDTAVTVAWLARFGRTVTQQVLEAVGERTQGESALGSEVSLGGHRVNEGSLAAGEEQEAETDVLTGRSGDYRIMSGREFLAASSFLVAMEPEGVEQAGGVSEEAVEGVRWTVWGRGATMSFEGLDEGGRLSIDGSVLTGLAGVDADVGGWLGGLAVGRSDGNGGYGWAADGDRPARAGDLEAELTSVYPYVRVAVTDWLSVWGVFGYGIGELRQVEEERLEEQTAIGMLLGALGGRGELLSVGGVELAVKADGYLLRMTSESTSVLSTVEADVRRLRLTAEGSGQVRIGSGLVVRPSVEVGVRHDGGEVENGTGVELGGGLSLADLGIGLALSGTARVLVTHEDRGYREWGAAGSLSFDPGAPGRGLAVQVDSSYGAAAGGAEQLWSQGAADLGDAAVPVGRVAAEVGYGVAQSDWSVRPYAGVELAGDAPEWRVGTRFGLGAHDVTVESSGATGSAAFDDSTLTIQYSLRW